MAYCRLGHIKENKGAGSKSIGLRNCIEYIFNPLKTENQALIGGYNIIPHQGNATNSTYEQMITTKNIFGKTDGRQGYHYKLSFAATDKVTPEMAMKITEEFCKRCFCDYECAYAIHTNTQHLHSHIVFNSIDLYEGKKYHYKKGDWANVVQPIANEICKEYGLSQLDLNLDEELRLKHKCKTYGKWSQEKGYDKKQSLNYSNKMIRTDVDECISKARDYEEFLQLMTEKGHKMNDEGKHLTILAPNRTRPCRSYVLSEDKQTYTRDNIKRMIDGTYLNPATIKEKLFEGWNAYLVERRKIVISSVRLSPEVAKEMENRKFRAEHNIKDKESLDLYVYQLESIDKQLNIMKKHVTKELTATQQYFGKMNEILGLMTDYQRYLRTHDPALLNVFNKVNSLYTELKRNNLNLEKLYLFNQKGKKIIEDIDSYKRHIFVEKKICKRLDVQMTENDKFKR